MRKFAGAEQTQITRIQKLAVTMTKPAEVRLRTTLDPQLAEEWELVLLAQGLTPRVDRGANGVVLSVPEEEVKTALASLAAYERENSPKLQDHDHPIEPPNWIAGIV